jgi:4-hydroxy-2-oxoheptanedioate aldolase
MSVNSTLRTRTLRHAALSCAMTATFAVALSAGFAEPAAAQQKVRANRLIEAFQTGKPALSGVDFQVVEAEHKTFVITNVVNEIKAVLANKNAQGQPVLPPIVRIPMEGDENAGWAIKAVMEAGAMGIIVPHLETSDQALRYIRSIRMWNTRDAKYPFPAGHRSGGGPNQWGIPSANATSGDIWPLNPDGEILFLPMIESLVAVNNLVEILETPGVSGVIVGPGDLSGSMGLAGQNPRPREVETLMSDIGRICRERNKVCGTVGRGNAESQKWLAAGYKFMWQLDLRDATSTNWYAQEYNR